MDTSPDETHFDVIVVGTGLTQAILAGALSRVGKKVLHLDRNDLYGGQMSSFSLQGLREWVTNTSAVQGEDGFPIDVVQSAQTSESWETIDIQPTTCDISSFIDRSFTDLTDAAENAESAESFEALARGSQYNIDLCPKMALAGNQLVDGLIQSGVARYLEFKGLHSTYVHTDGALRFVPTSKSEIFQDTFISPLEKRALMKITKFCLEHASDADDEQQYQQFKSGPFVELLKVRKVSPRLQNFILYAIAGASVDQTAANSPLMTTEEGVRRVKNYVESIGRFGSCAFLYPLYGVSELPQAFCRLSAVYGGVYILRNGPKQLLVDPSTKSFKGVITEQGHRFTADHLVSELDYLPISASMTVKETGQVRHVVAILQGTVKADATAPVVFIIPTNALDNADVIQVLQIGHESMCAPKGKSLIHLMMRDCGTAAEDLQRALHFVVQEGAAQMFKQRSKPVATEQDSDSDPESAESDDESSLIPDSGAEPLTADELQAAEEMKEQQRMERRKQREERQKRRRAEQEAANTFIQPRVLFTFSYLQVQRQVDGLDVANVHFTEDLNDELDMDSCVVEARALFTSLFPAEEFLPHTANPDEQNEEEREMEDLATYDLPEDNSPTTGTADTTTAVDDNTTLGGATP
eukprot:GILK01004534.1.p1 GENE.GILK01004534.1~~GILK01004534.1.p1  ORF type:complete len:653 (-),score=135.49 GILK01004534.1:82-1998(-)